MIKAILFDLDGTLADSAPDLVAAANQQRLHHNLEPLPYEELRNLASKGSVGLLNKALGLNKDDEDFESKKARFLKDYESISPSNTKLFPGIETLLSQIEERNLVWGIVTNKVEYLTFPVAKYLALSNRSQVLVCGDTTDQSKPSPKPLLYAAQQMKVDPQYCIYIGDDERDIIAGKAAGMKTIAITYGYSINEHNASDYDPDAIASNPNEIIKIISAWL